MIFVRIGRLPRCSTKFQFQRDQLAEYIPAVLSRSLVLQLLDAWLAATFEGGRHTGRVAKLDALGGERV